MNVRVALRDDEQLKIPEMLGIDDEYLAGHPKGKFWQLCWKIAENIPYKNLFYLIPFVYNS